MLARIVYFCKMLWMNSLFATFVAWTIRVLVLANVISLKRSRLSISISFILPSFLWCVVRFHRFEIAFRNGEHLYAKHKNNCQSVVNDIRLKWLERILWLSSITLCAFPVKWKEEKKRARNQQNKFKIVENLRLVKTLLRSENKRKCMKKSRKVVDAAYLPWHPSLVHPNRSWLKCNRKLYANIIIFSIGRRWHIVNFDRFAFFFFFFFVTDTKPSDANEFLPVSSMFRCHLHYYISFNVSAISSCGRKFSAAQIFVQM